MMTIYVNRKVIIFDPRRSARTIDVYLLDRFYAKKLKQIIDGECGPSAIEQVAFVLTIIFLILIIK